MVNCFFLAEAERFSPGDSGSGSSKTERQEGTQLWTYVRDDLQEAPIRQPSGSPIRRIAKRNIRQIISEEAD